MNRSLTDEIGHGGKCRGLHDPAGSLLYAELRDARRKLASYRDELAAIQRSIRPQQLPCVANLDLAVHTASADGPGGDFYDVRSVRPGKWAIVMADVSGHDLAAAAILAVVHALGSAVNRQQGLMAPGAALEFINRPLATQYLAHTDKFVSAFVGLYDAQTQVLTYASAGHPPPRLVRGGVVRWLDDVAGLPLGLAETSIYEQSCLQLQAGDRLVLFTDGITESCNAAESMFGDERLDEVLSASAGSAAELLQQIVDAVQTFRARPLVTDDETCLVAFVKRGPSTTPEPRK